MTTNTAARATFSSAWVFIMATIGSAVGLGNIWKFPYMVGLYGGAAFVIVYFIFMFLFGLPVAMSEIMLGRRAKRCATDAYEALAIEAGTSPKWRYLGFFAMLCCVLTLGFYCVVGGWVLNYFVDSFTGFSGVTAEGVKSDFAAFLNSPWRQLFWHFVFLVLSAAIVILGVDKGIGRANSVMIPGLFGILLFLLVYAMIYGDFSKAVDYMFTADWSKLNANVILAALGHAFFSMSIGFGALMIYGSYIQGEVNLASSTLYVTLANLFIAVFCGLIIFSFVFQGGLEPSVGPGLVMQAVPLVFSQMPFSFLVAPLFYILIFFATITTSVSFIEPSVAYLLENYPSIGRKRATIYTCFIIWLAGVAVALGFNVWKDVSFMGFNIFDTFDALTSRLIMPIGAMLSAIFIGWFMKRHIVQHEINLQGWQWQAWFFIIRFVAPPLILFVFLSGFDFF